LWAKICGGGYMADAQWILLESIERAKTPTAAA
jgi:hypothetical protein